MQAEAFQPKIVAFCCHYCAYSSADLAGSMRIQYPPNVRIIRTPCTGRLETEYFMKALENGADGVLVAGCHPGECHYLEQNYKAMRRFAVIKHTVRQMGLEDNRLRLVWASAAEGQQLAEAIDRFVDDVRALGPLRWPGLWHENGQRLEALESIVKEHQAAMEVQA